MYVFNGFYDVATSHLGLEGLGQGHVGGSDGDDAVEACGKQGLSVWCVLAVRIQANRPGLCKMCFHGNSNFSPFYRVTLMILNI